MKYCLYFLLSSISLLGCQEKEIKFNSEKWMIRKDIEDYSYRSMMLKDIIQNNLFIGKNYQSLKDSLGIPANYNNQKASELIYIISIDYGIDIDPIYSKHIVFEMNSDSIITSCKVIEYPKP